VTVGCLPFGEPAERALWRLGARSRGCLGGPVGPGPPSGPENALNYSGAAVGLSAVRDVVRRDAVQVISPGASAQPGAPFRTTARDAAPHIIQDPVEIARPVSHEDERAEKAMEEAASTMPLTVAALREEAVKSHASDPKPVPPPAPDRRARAAGSEGPSSGPEGRITRAGCHRGLVRGPRWNPSPTRDPATTCPPLVTRPSPCFLPLQPVWAACAREMLVGSPCIMTAVRQ